LHTAKDPVRTKIDVKPLFEDVFHIDLSRYVKVVPLKRFFDQSQRVVKSEVCRFGETVGHQCLLFVPDW